MNLQKCKELAKIIAATGQDAMSTKERFYYNNGFYYNTQSHSASVPPRNRKGRVPRI